MGTKFVVIRFFNLYFDSSTAKIRLKVSFVLNLHKLPLVGSLALNI